MDNENILNGILDGVVKLIAPKFLEALRPQLVELVKETVAKELQESDGLRDRIEREVEEQIEGLDMQSLVNDNIDMDNITDEVSRNMDTSDIVSSVMDELDIDAIAEQVRSELDLEDEIKDVIGGLELKVTVA